MPEITAYIPPDVEQQLLQDQAARVQTEAAAAAQQSNEHPKIGDQYIPSDIQLPEQTPTTDQLQPLPYVAPSLDTVPVTQEPEQQPIQEAPQTVPYISEQILPSQSEKQTKTEPIRIVVTSPEEVPQAVPLARVEVPHAEPIAIPHLDLQPVTPENIHKSVDIDAILGPFKPKKLLGGIPDLDTPSEAVQQKNDQDYRQKLQIAIEHIADSQSRGNTEQTRQTVRNILQASDTRHTTLSVLVAIGYGDVVMQTALDRNGEPTITVHDVLLACNTAIDNRAGEDELEILQHEAMSRALAAIEQAGLQTLDPSERRAYLYQKLSQTWTDSNDSTFNISQVQHVLPDIVPQLSEDDVMYADFLILEHAAESTHRTQQQTSELLTVSKQMLQDLIAKQAVDYEAFQNSQDVKSGLLKIARELKDAVFVDEILAAITPDEIYGVTYDLPHLTAEGHAQQVVALLERSDFDTKLVRLKSVLATVARMKDDELVDRMLAMIHAELAPNADGTAKNSVFGLDTLVSESILTLALHGYADDALRLVQNQQQTKFEYHSRVSSIDNEKVTGQQVIAQLLTEQSPQSIQLAKILLTNLQLYGSAAVEEFQHDVSQNPQLADLCRQIIQEKTQALLQQTPPEEIKNTFARLKIFSLDSGLPLGEEVTKTLATDFIQNVYQLKQQGQLPEAEYVEIAEYIIRELNSEIAIMLRGSDYEKRVARLDAMLQFGQLQDTLQAIDSLPLHNDQIHSLLSLLGSNQTYNLLVGRMLKEQPKNPEVITQFLDSMSQSGQKNVQEYFAADLFLNAYVDKEKRWVVHGLSKDYVLELLQGTKDIAFTVEALDSIFQVSRENFMNLDNEVVESLLTSENPHQVVETFVLNAQEYSPRLQELFTDLGENKRLLYSHQRVAGKILEKLLQAENPQLLFETVLQNKNSLGELNEYLGVFLQSDELRTELAIRLISPDASERFKRLHQVIADNQDIIERLNDPSNIMYEFRDAFFTQLILSGDQPVVLNQLRRVFDSTDLPVWSKLYTLVSLRYSYLAEGQNKNGYSEIVYPVTEIPLIKQNLGESVDALTATDDQITMRDLTSMTADELKRFLIDMPDSSLQNLVGQPIPFNSIKTEYRMQIFAHYLRDTIERTIRPEYKQAADERNRQLAQQFIAVDEGTLLHGTSMALLPKILGLGSLCGEALEIGHKLDATPLQVDLALFAGQERAEGTEAVDLIGQTEQAKYGDFTIMFKRTEGTKDEGVIHNYGPWKDKGQVLIPGGIAATEIVGIYFKDGLDARSASDLPKTELQTLKRQVVRNGFYIPMYDQAGELVFTPEEYDQMKARLADKESRLQHIEALRIAESLPPREFVDVLSDDPALEVEFAASSGVSEGYTLREHTEAILGQFEKNFAATFESTLLSRSAFRTMLALHDIGKAQAVTQAGSTSAQHAYTVALVQDKAASLGMTERETTIMTTLLEHDYLGEVIKEHTSVEQTAQNIRTMAEQLQASPSDVLDALLMYYMCDASSYTDDASYSSNSGLQQIKAVASINFVFDFSGDTIQLSPKNRDIIARLREQLSQA